MKLSNTSLESITRSSNVLQQGNLKNDLTAVLSNKKNTQRSIFMGEAKAIISVNALIRMVDVGIMPKT
ncbi:hypothetical protein VNO77_44022 [Canavalia gladiata]|uniref:Uncharacterized protein n=1 Tax=Canavalia gladiata TaxID=3824 RepID=A0AAN9JVW3_CANGL